MPYILISSTKELSLSTEGGNQRGKRGAISFDFIIFISSFYTSYLSGWFILLYYVLSLLEVIRSDNDKMMV